MADITITIQAAGDAVMTENGLSSGTPLAEGDARKVYGLPNISSYGIASDESNSIIKWNTALRWDTVKLPVDAVAIYSAGALTSYRTPYLASLAATKSPPTTTAFQLRCDNITHEFTDNVTIVPIPAFDVSPDQHDSAGTPGQLNMIVMALGMRSEKIKLSGMLVDRGLVTAANPRRQILLNIARMQHYKTGRGGQGSENAQRWGGKDSGALNPRSFTCLTIFEAHTTPGFSMGREPSGDSRQYRGIIKELSFRMEGGRPDHWFWNMTFDVIANEHSDEMFGARQAISPINRIRLVDDRDGTGSAITAGTGYIEVRTSKELRIWNPLVPGGEEAQTVKRELKDNDVVFMSNTDSVPTINGYWHVTGVNIANKTFIVLNNAGIDYEELTVMDTDGNNEGTSQELQWAFSNFTAGDAGSVGWALADGSGSIEVPA